MYSLCEEGESIAVFDKTLQAYNEYCGVKRKKKYLEFTGYLKKSCDKHGFDYFEFKSEDESGRDSVFAFKYTGEFRFYFYYDARERILLGGGGKKTTKSHQDDPILNYHVRCLTALSKLINNNDEVTLQKLLSLDCTIKFSTTGDIINQEEILEEIGYGNETDL